MFRKSKVEMEWMGEWNMDGRCSLLLTKHLASCESFIHFQDKARPFLQVRV